MFKCVRCKHKYETMFKGEVLYGVNGTLKDYHGFIVCLCPDCQLPEKKVYKGMTSEETEYFCGEIRNLEDCLKTQEKRIAANERQIERLWEVIKCLGEKG